MTRQTGPIDVDLDEPIEIVEPRDDWATPFAAEAAALHGALGPLVLAVEHIGSTAVPGLVAKPIIDIQVGVAGPPELARVFAPLVALGYESLGQAGVPGRLYFRRRSAHAYNVHVVAFGGVHWIANLALRDYLRANPSEAAGYAAAKRAAVAAGATSLLDYSEHKAAFLTALVERALAKSEPRHRYRHNGPEDPSAPRFENVTPVLRVESMRVSLDFYVRLGFQIVWDWGEPTTFACIKRGDVSIFLCEKDQGTGATWLFIDVDDVDRLHDEYVRRGIAITKPPVDQPWNRREMHVEDPDGHTFRFASAPIGGEA
jgi:GrpB-like predicted nucleotidyltransferase (UPF0157 family)/catechol 2,3-dioxygenase-like lactoylglutathione lyase family enzyme